jgi:hypothetical protein
MVVSDLDGFTVLILAPHAITAYFLPTHRYKHTNGSEDLGSVHNGQYEVVIGLYNSVFSSYYAS